MIFIDTNALLILIVGLIDPGILKNHKRTSIYDEDDYYALVSMIGDFKKLVVLPNIWTELDNLLNDFSGNRKYQYIQVLSESIRTIPEVYLSSALAIDTDTFFALGLTDSLVLIHAKECELLITADSALSDYARAYGITVYDIVEQRNSRLR